MKGDTLYWFLTSILDWVIWGGEIINEENLPDKYPVVFVSNHATALGPIAVTSSLPVRVYPWVISDMLDWSKAAEYLRRDFVEPQLQIPPSLSLIVSRMISQVSVRLLRAVDCIPVWHGAGLLETFRISVDMLEEGKSLLIFPEDPSQKMNELYEMSPFYKGFVRLGEIYYDQTKKCLPFYPLAVHPVVRKIRVGKPVTFSPENDPIRERLRIKHGLESTIHNLYLSMTFEGHTGIPLPH